MPECEYCSLSEKGEIILDSGKVIAAMHPKASVKGQVLVTSKEHFTIIEQVPDQLLDELFKAANQASTAIFESLEVSGTNVFVENGTAAGQKAPHVSVNVVPRTDKDGLDFSWNPKQLTEDEMSTAELQLKEHLQHAGGFEQPSKKEMKVEEKKTETFSEGDDYRIKQLRRTP